MQASTVLMLSIGMALLYDHSDADTFRRFFSSFLGKLQTTDYSKIAPLTKKEAKLYTEKKYLNYLADSHLAISILTDTTERSPTFSLRGFENRLDSSAQHALSYLFILESQDSTDAWFKMLGRSPRPLEWSQLEGKIGLDKVLGFDISESGSLERSNKIPCINFNIIQRNHLISFECEDIKVEFNWGIDPLFNHLMLKMLLNAHSTLIMGLLGRYEGNIMTWVRPSNNKLIDRAARYILELARRKNKVLTYEEVVLKIFEEIEHIKEDEPVVIRVLDKC
jgi:N-acetylmuramic acid 6-phosphate etherase